MVCRHLNTRHVHGHINAGQINSLTLKHWTDKHTDIISQWCTTSGPRATSGPRRVVKWPARPNRKSTISDTALALKPTHLGLISQHLNDFKLKVQGENQLGYHSANYCSAFKANRCCLHFIHFILST